MKNIIDIDYLSDNSKALGYNDGKKQRFRAPILPCNFVTTSIHSQPVADVICFFDKSPVMIIAEQRNQILRYETEVPGKNNTPLVIVFKNYVIRRIAEIKLHKMTPPLIFDDIFKHAKINPSASYDFYRTRYR